MSEISLNEGEYHPVAPQALEWFRQWRDSDIKRYYMVRESLASTALSGNRTAEICNSTLTRLDNAEVVSDRYLFGLVWFLRENFND